GDGMLAEFSSVVEAVSCAVEVQCAMSLRNAGVAEDRRLAFRIGINVGDVIAEPEDIFGDGVNIAARLEGLAEPNGICISQTVHEQIRCSEASCHSSGCKSRQHKESSPCCSDTQRQGGGPNCRKPGSKSPLGPGGPGSIRRGGGG